MIRMSGPRVRLRDITLDELDLYRHWRMPGHRWQRFDGPYYPVESAAEIDRMIEGLRRHLEAGKAGKPSSDPPSRQVIARRSDDLMIGTVSWYWLGKETDWAAAGIVLFDEADWGKGLGYEALGLWLDYLFRSHPKFVRLDLQTWSGNTGMLRLAEKLGFKLEARYRKSRIVDGVYFDGIGYGVLREEWDQRYPGGFEAHVEAAEGPS